MSTNIPSKWVADEHRTQVNVIVTENAFFGALNCLVEYRRGREGLTKACLADRLGKDRGTVTKLTSGPTNMKVSTIACMADALDAHVALIFMAKENTSIVFTATGIRDCGQLQIGISNVRAVERLRPSTMLTSNWVEQPEVIDA